MLVKRTSERLALERLSIASSLASAKDGNEGFDLIKTPTDLETGALRDGDAPKYSSPEILALLFQYACVGLVDGGIYGMQYPILTGYFQLQGNVLSSANALMSLGWSLKVFFGLLTDCLPIGGYRRKPYILLGWTCTAILLVIVATKPAGAPAPDPAASENGAVLALLCAVGCFFYIMADVAQDALLVSYAQREPAAVRGRLQSLIYSVRTLFSAAITAVVGFCLNSERMAGSYDWDIGVNGFFSILAATAVVNLPIVWFFLKDTKAETAVPVGDYVHRFWLLAQKRVVWQVMIFFFTYGLCTSNINTTAAPYVQLYWARVETLNVALTSILGGLIVATVIAVTGKFGTHWNWRYVMVITTLAANAIDAVVVFCTIYNVLRDQWFFLGVPLTTQVPAGIGFVVGSYVIVELAEEGSEGVMYGLITTVANLPGVFGPMLTNVINSQFAVGKDLIERDSRETRNQVAYTYVISYAATIIGCLCVFLLPNQKAAVAHLKATGGSYPRVAGVIFYGFFAILATSITGTMCSMFESTNCLMLAGGGGCPPGTSQLYLLGIFVPAGLALVAVGYLHKTAPPLTEERISYVSALSGAKDLGEDFNEVKTPEALEGGALRDGDAPKYSSPEILALLFSYACVGIVDGGIQNMQYPILTSYFKLEGNVLNSASALMLLGWSLKVFFGMLSDCFPIFNRHRKPYILLGWTLAAVLLVIVAVKPAGNPSPDPNAYSNGSTLALLCAVGCFFYIMADVAQDALLVSYAQREPVAVRGQLQSAIYATRTLFNAAITAVSGFCLNSVQMAGSYDWDIGVNGYFWILAAAAVINVPVVWFFMKDNKPSGRVPVGVYFNQFWTLAQKRVVWQVMGFNFLFSLFTGYISTTAGPYVQLYWAGVENLNSALMSILGSVIFAAVLVATGKYGTHWNWRYVMVITTLAANAIDAVVVFCTVYNVLRDQWFFLGVPLTTQLPAGINFVVGTYVIVELAEVGNEGIMYGLLTTITNLPGVFGPMLTNVINSQFAVGKDLIELDSPETRDQVAYTYMIRYASTIIGCLCVFLLPNQKAAVAHLKATGGSYPRVAGVIFYGFFAILATSITGTMCSMFESTNCLMLAGGEGCEESPSQLYLLGIFVPCGLALAAIVFKLLRA
ncbi:folate-Biopterin Transporter (FBT) family [Achlya hypogyna]|uniref:Folate-Biopterin Transporter (FBT) family n=1 Tax=Achlya hypogyna TaxID=1202772 RepID=A0A1V9YFL6_ACHHY|nr:folate-Biopterin Transporter (FBT) family [Achlya hypogyna]